MKNAINWFEIPVKNFEKARKFYETILSAEMQFMEAMGMKSAFFPAEMETEGSGKILLPKTAIGHNGFMAHFTDTEGNKVGLHSIK
jgi:predicted enzyme related to lactoylglutathione lyase